MTLLHIDPGQLGPDLPDGKIIKLTSALQAYALAATGARPAGAFCLLLATLGDYIDKTDAAVDLLNIALEQLLEQRDQALKRGVKPTLKLKPGERGPLSPEAAS